MPLLFGDIYFPENFNTEFAPLKEKIETLINLSRTAGNERRYSILNNKLMRICLLVGLSTPGKRDVRFVERMTQRQDSVVFLRSASLYRKQRICRPRLEGARLYHKTLHRQ